MQNVQLSWPHVRGSIEWSCETWERRDLVRDT